jgi:hypothetical protein
MEKHSTSASPSKSASEVQFSLLGTRWFSNRLIEDRSSNRAQQPLL